MPDYLWLGYVWVVFQRLAMRFGVEISARVFILEHYFALAMPSVK